MPSACWPWWPAFAAWVSERRVWPGTDFGTGFSSISHLHDLPVHRLKLELSFTAGVGDGDLRNLRLAQALVGMANGPDLDTVAEGVKTPEQADLLRTQGWQPGQG